MGKDVKRGQVRADAVEKVDSEKREVVSKREVLESIVGVVLARAGELGLSCKNSLVRGVQKSKVFSSC